MHLTLRRAVRILPYHSGIRERSMIRLSVAMALLVAMTGTVRADAAAFQALGADSQLIVNKVTGNKPTDTAVCAQGHDGLKSSITDATKSLYFAGSLKGDPREAGTAAGDYLKTLCKH
jgi:hypothetical protein